jgi:hypothetical protein
MANGTAGKQQVRSLPGWLRTAAQHRRFIRTQRLIAWLNPGKQLFISL